MNEMIERVARAICKSHGLHPDADAFKHGALRHYPIWQTYEEDARAAVEALRVPTQAMLEAGQEALPDPVNYNGPVDCIEPWDAMINEILK
jgi:hypothetical protein